MSRIPEKPSEHEAEGIPDPGFSDPGQLIAGDTEAATEPPHDFPIAAYEFGTTARELHDGESHSLRIDREEPEVILAADEPPDEDEDADNPFRELAGAGVGRLVEPDEGAHTDDEPDMIASDVGVDLGGYSAEEAAMHVVYVP